MHACMRESANPRRTNIDVYTDYWYDWLFVDLDRGSRVILLKKRPFCYCIHYYCTYTAVSRCQ